ncbi:DUF1800 domain-containing protein [soil metagenome]
MNHAGLLAQLLLGSMIAGYLMVSAGPESAAAPARLSMAKNRAKPTAAGASVSTNSPISAPSYAASSAASSASTFAPASTPRPMNEDQKVVQVLNRMTMGAAPGDFERVKTMGVKAYIASQLNPNSIAENQIVVDQVQSAEILHEKSADLIKKFRLLAAQKKEKLKSVSAPGSSVETARQLDNSAGSDKADRTGQTDKPDKSAAAKEAMQERQKYVKVVSDQIYKTRMIRALDSERQLQEVMVDFWYNHFNISINKGLDHVLIGAYEEQAIRPNALGRFRDILGATCYHPAMLFYLDNWQNAAAGTNLRTPPGLQANGAVKAPAKKKGGLNENYARELMELHTLGVDGGYTQTDVIELARVLTGLSLPINGYWGQFFPARHDQGTKVILGHTITASGAGEIEEALDFLSRHPSTAHHISFALAQYFVADQPPKALVDRLAKRFSESDGDIKAVLTTLFESHEFFDAQYLNSKYKSPFRYTVSALRASGARPVRYEPIYSFMRLQGQPLYGCLTPDGYKNTKEAWLNSDALLKRINFATTIGSPATKGPGAMAQSSQPYDLVLRTVNGGQLSPRTSEVIAKSGEPFKTALLLGSPEFMSY